jgi:hypothetical protein
MAHWAEIDETNTVIRVLVGDNDDPNGDEGYQWLIDNLGGRWIQTSYNNNFRVRFAGPGYLYNEELDVFLKPKPFSSWVLDQESFDWIAPVLKPREDRFYWWNEETINWELFPSPFPSWVLEDDEWMPPIPYPNDGKPYSWNEETISWVEVELSTPNK